MALLKSKKSHLLLLFVLSYVLFFALERSLAGITLLDERINLLREFFLLLDLAFFDNFCLLIEDVDILLNTVLVLALLAQLVQVFLFQLGDISVQSSCNSFVILFLPVLLTLFSVFALLFQNASFLISPNLVHDLLSAFYSFRRHKRFFILRVLNAVQPENKNQDRL